MRLGVYGGTFYPVHHAHVVVAADARPALALERVLLVPAGEPVENAGGGVAPHARCGKWRRPSMPPRATNAP